MKKNYLSLVIFLCVLNFGFGQTTIIDFETAGAGYTPSGTEGTGFTDVFNRSNPNIGGNNTFLWAVEDINLVNPSITLDQINVTGGSSFTFSIDMLAHHFEDWDSTDELLITYSIDGGAVQNLMWIQMVPADASNGPAALDLGFDGDGDCGVNTTLPSLTTGTQHGCTVSNNQFATFITPSIPLSGNTTLDINLQFNNLTAADEGIYLDNIIIDVQGGSPTCSITDIALSNSGSCNDNGTASDASDDYYTADVTVTYSNAPASGTIDLTGTGVVGGTTSIAVGTSPQTITNVQLAANGSDVEIIATFSAETTCNYTETVVGSGETSCSGTPSGDCASESFVNAGNDGSYGPVNWIGDDGIGWSATDARSDQDLAGDEAIILRNGSLTNDTSFSGGCGVISFDYAQIFSGASTLQVYINGVQYGGDVNVNSTTSTNFSTTVNVSGAIDVELRNAGNRTLISNLSWTCFACTGTPADASNFVATDACGAIDLSWDAPTCADEVLVVARETNAVTATPSGDGSSYTADTQFGNGTALLAGQFAVYKNNGTSSSITGLTVGSAYHFTIFSRVGSTWSSGATTNVTYTGTIENPASFTSFNDCGDIGLQWTNPACFDEILVVARATSAVTATPTGDGSSYTADAQFGNGTALLVGQHAVYKDVSDNVTITGLTDGVTYHFEIFTRVGNSWSSGATTTATANSSGSTGPTTFNPGDIVFVGYDSYIGGATDRYSLLNMVDIGVGTEFIMANLLYEWNAAANVSTNRWYDCHTDFDGDPPYASITYNGCSDIPKGSIICIATNGSGNIIYMTVNGISVTVGTSGTEDFVVDSVNDTVGNISTSNADAMWLMQGAFSNVLSDIGDGNDNNAADDRYRTFTGTVLGALQTKGDFRLFSETGGNWTGTTSERRVSRIHPDAECVFLQTGSTSSTRFYGYHNGITSGTQYQLLADIIDQSNWILQSGTGGVQDSDNIDFLCGSSYTVTGGGTSAGLWVGSVSDDWFDCRNWENFAVPSADVDVTIDGTASTNSKIDHTTANASKFGGLAECNNLTITGSSLDISESNLNILTINGDILMNTSGILDMDDSNSSTDDGIIYLLGDWINQTNDAFLEGNGTIVFTGSTAQNISYGTIPLPPINTEQFYNVILNNDFNTNTSNDLFLNGELTINSVATLTVTDGRYVHVDDAVTNNGTFNIENNGSLIQVQDVNNTGNLTMNRNYNVDSSLDYIYWSSPVENFNTNNLPVNNNHIYTWNPTAPNTGNGEGNWESAVGQIMAEGIGYIARSPGAVPNTMVFQNGVPRNGDVNLNLSRGTDSADDNDDWNLLGNPYPSAISAMDFLTANSNLEGFVNLWTHGVQPLQTEPDPFYENNNGFNYDEDDYITANGTSTTCSPNDNTICFDGFIAAGQSFMVNTIDGGASSTINVSFTNAMRRRDYDNSNFFRSSNPEEKHRIWLDLGLSDQDNAERIVLGYVPFATLGEDRLYDAEWIGDESGQRFYSIIDDKDFLIQGRGLPFSDTDVIPLGYNTTVTGNYTIAVNAVDGLFINDQEIYLKDNTLNITHNLSNAPYTFNSETGEFNERFEIVFRADALSIDDNIIDSNELIITELSDGDVQIKVSSPFTITNVEVLDVLGRQVYNLQGNNSVEIYDLSKLSNAAYIAKVTLSNGQVISKKAIKQK